jgi:FAD/FMN-containing dehydrogenase/Fe-S oxidoreductase
MVRVEGLRKALRDRGVKDVRVDSTSRALYSSDASLYRVTPTAVVFPTDHDEVVAAVAVSRTEGVPLTARGAGTSIAGNAVGTGLVLDFSRYMNRVLSVDPQTRTAVVEPGVVQSVLQKAAAPFALRFGPDPSSLTRCTIGGMIGNNACGSRALGYGRTSDNVVAMRILTARGEDLRLTTPERSGSTPRPESPMLDELQAVTRAGLSTIRTEFGRFGRQVSGYALEHLLPEKGFDMTRMLVGSEGTLGVCTEATVRLVTDPPQRALVVLGYPDIAAAGDATPLILPYAPSACEGIDSRIVDVVRERKGSSAIPPLPAGRAWLFVEVVGDTADDVAAKAALVEQASTAPDSMVITDATRAAALWQIRADGAGLSARSPAGRPAHAGWEDAAVPPERLGAYLRDFDALMSDFGVTGMPYGHFGDGCLHIRIDWPLERSDGTAIFRRFLVASAEMVAGYGGSLSGEHGDGRARSELLPLMYSPAALSLMAAVKHTFDPDNILNPGVVVDPLPFDVDVRTAAAPPLRRDLAMSYRHDAGDFSQAVHRCTGVGKCRADNTTTGDVMCPSYQATREEKDSTRGRARVLQEMLNGNAVRGGWRSPEVHEALDLCLSCKGCASDCPTGVDMAAYKSEVLYQSYRRRIRPASHYSLGWLPRWAQLAARAPRLANKMLAVPRVGPAAMAMAGVDRRRGIPALAPRSFRSWFAANTPTGPGDEVLLFVDTFTDYFAPNVGIATVRVLVDAGYRPRLTAKPQCCGLTWISTGQLDVARRVLGRTVNTLAPGVDQGLPVVGMEPSCTAVLRSDAVELVGGRDAEQVSANTHTLAELLTARGWEPPSLAGQQVIAQPHCHHHSVMGWSRDAELLRTAGAELTRLGGCCGLAGNFGVEKGHYEVSVAVAEQQLLPAVRAAEPAAVMLADGFSCRTQLDDLTDRSGIHLAQLLADALSPDDHPTPR